jgi:lysozyme
MLNPSQVGIDLIKQCESCRLSAYKDEKGVWTIGWGHTPAIPGQTCSQEQADSWLSEDIARAAMAVNDRAKYPLTQNMFDALVSFTFNLGVGHFASSTLLALLNAGHINDAAYEFPKWSHVGSVVSKGLFLRRMREATLFLNG